MSADTAALRSDRASEHGAVVANSTQHARRERILTVAVGLAAGGGYEAVQMRTVAEKAGVALGTLYRYFPSKELLLSAALIRRLRGAGADLRSAPRIGDDPATRVIVVMNLLIDGLDRNPRLVGAFIQAMTSSAAGVAIDEAEAAMRTVIGAAIYGPDHVADERDKVATEIIGKAFLTDLHFWQVGRRSVDELRAAVAATVQVVLAGQYAYRPVEGARSADTNVETGRPEGS
ncbi:DNA-binding transcriptional regulator, AcrR family [Parafrankia irregularis]|uniref:DNA-binding transcriptional regulator, AcrR family n=1 Tax=Parafrankia irregularis TaxID=795642 RepID=A0A0S4QSX1_9ACTN|nr:MULTISPECIES: TetR family transcriptional regulator [Parafrankia]MBE3202755.1 TetR/AcrR family transcriptional regulator [Parafrankia sp. CH37]CUU57944.1 DNA-binding transcriptional regulator, AcrR family [Parafrankia irregularis]